jgi:hypothetical protein
MQNVRGNIFAKYSDRANGSQFVWKHSSLLVIRQMIPLSQVYSKNEKEELFSSSVFADRSFSSPQLAVSIWNTSTVPLQRVKASKPSG